jgi:hypothetical protein
MFTPAIFALVAFCAVQIICAALNFGDGFMLSIIAAGAVFVMSYRQRALMELDRDKPELLTYRMPIHQAYSLTKEVLRTFRWGRRRWQITNANDTALSINAVSEWDDHSFKGNKLVAPEGTLFRQIILDVHVMPGSTPELANVELSWQVTSPVTRSECNSLQDYTKGAIKQVLEDNQGKN